MKCVLKEPIWNADFMSRFALTERGSPSKTSSGNGAFSKQARGIGDRSSDDASGGDDAISLVQGARIDMDLFEEAEADAIVGGSGRSSSFSPVNYVVARRLFLARAWESRERSAKLYSAASSGMTLAGWRHD
jgi:hypothetical protein